MACVYLFFRDQLQNNEKITSICSYIYKYKRVFQLNASSTFSWGLQVSYLRSSLCAVLSYDILKCILLGIMSTYYCMDFRRATKA